MVIGKILIYWVTGDIAELCDVFYTSVEWKLRASEREKKQVRSGLLQKLRLKINIAAYGRVVGVLFTSKSVSPTSEIRPSAESQHDFLHFYVYSVYVK